MNIAIDGPAGTGKTTIANLLSKKYGIMYLNTGNMYRAMALYYFRRHKEINEEIVNNEIDNVNIAVEYKDGQQITLLNGEPVDAFLREEKISMLASQVSSYKTVRERLVETQQKIAKSQSIILDGRDIGTVVLPKADVKFFLTASSDVRAERRYRELNAKGINADIAKIKLDIEKRDYDDSHRQNSPLKKAEDAYLIDTSNMTIEQVCETCDSIIKSKVHHLC